MLRLRAGNSHKCLRCCSSIVQQGHHTGYLPKLVTNIAGHRNLARTFHMNCRYKVANSKVFLYAISTNEDVASSKYSFDDLSSWLDVSLLPTPWARQSSSPMKLIRCCVAFVKCSGDLQMESWHCEKRDLAT